MPLHYAAAKVALNTFSRGLAEKVAGVGVRVNIVTPSSTRTNPQEGKDGYAAQVAAHMGIDHADLLAALPGQNGMLTGALIDPDEIARAVVLLSSPTMPSAIGSNWTVDAGALRSPEVIASRKHSHADGSPQLQTPSATRPGRAAGH